MCDKHCCRIYWTDVDYVMFKCDKCGLKYAVDREFLDHALQGVWPVWFPDDAIGVRW